MPRGAGCPVVELVAGGGVRGQRFEVAARPSVPFASVCDGASRAPVGCVIYRCQCPAREKAWRPLCKAGAEGASDHLRRAFVVVSDPSGRTGPEALSQRRTTSPPYDVLYAPNLVPTLLTQAWAGWLSRTRLLLERGSPMIESAVC